MDTAKIFTTGRSQAVRLPKAFRFEGKEVCIKQIGSAVVLFDPRDRENILLGSLGKVSDDFLRDRRQPSKPDRRRPL